jgi:hypothetical protein
MVLLVQAALAAHALGTTRKYNTSHRDDSAGDQNFDPLPFFDSNLGA